MVWIFLVAPLLWHPCNTTAEPTKYARDPTRADDDIQTRTSFPDSISKQRTRRRTLSEVKDVSSFGELQSAIYSGEAFIRLASGTYSVTSTIVPLADVTLLAAEGAQVVLDGQDARRVMEIRSGRNINLIGITITRG